MSKRRLALIAVLILVAIISLAVMRSRLVGSPEDACAAVPPATKSKQNPGNAAIQIISPKHGTDATMLGQLPIVLEVNNFEPKEYLKIALWVDGKPAATRFDGYRVWLGQDGPATQKREGTHNICVAPVDNRTGEEVGNRVGARVYLRWRGPDEVDFRWIEQSCCLWGSILVVGVIFFVVNEIDRKSVSRNLDKMD
jgi:hypothetical protein